ncbi:unnamed protein product [Lactuca saligna]|uniref:Uncharacterized protein n=1 Tax=Lactuca saligna TaxID=75948 RepID=A0AA36E5I0_LACSI|nr:unnamed protein product [Lactuca saligna]
MTTLFSSQSKDHGKDSPHTMQKMIVKWFWFSKLTFDTKDEDIANEALMSVKQEHREIIGKNLSEFKKSVERKIKEVHDFITIKVKKFDGMFLGIQKNTDFRLGVAKTLVQDFCVFNIEYKEVLEKKTLTSKEHFNKVVSVGSSKNGDEVNGKVDVKVISSQILIPIPIKVMQTMTTKTTTSSSANLNVEIDMSMVQSKKDLKINKAGSSSIVKHVDMISKYKGNGSQPTE